MKSKSTMARFTSVRRISLRKAIPIRTICAWCAFQDRPAAVLVDVPLDSRGMSHGICPSCRSNMKSDSLTALSQARPRVGQHGRVDELR